jgi:Tol biopolymer transport system component
MMPLAASTRLGPYEIVSLAGVGGMGEVYRALDTRLSRTVAVKVLPERLCASAQFRERFAREAQVIANLNHPNICPLYDVGNERGVDYLVMEFLEGETLAQRLKKSRLPLDQALRYAIQVAGALDQAHRQGVVHRDLKPGNVMLTKSGAKLMDFGLAKLCSQAPGQSATDGTAVILTEPGAILGTYLYMAPEQIQGAEADSRADIFAFGAMLYEMVAGRKAFDGKSQASVIAAILEHQPLPIGDLPEHQGAALERLIRKALSKAPDDRWQTAHDLKDELEWIAGEKLSSSPLIAARRRRIALAAAIALAGGGLFAIAFWMTLRSGPAVQTSVRFSIPLPEGTVFRAAASIGPTPQLAVSPDGRMIVFAAAEQDKPAALWLRPLDAFVAHTLPETGGATFPFWSPDSRNVAFFADNKLKAIDIYSRQVRPIADAPDGRGGTWNRDGDILFADNVSSTVKRVRLSGGTVTDATVFDQSKDQTSHRFPSFLPDGRHFSYLALAGPNDTGLYLGRLDSTESALILPGKWGSAVVTGGRLLAVHEGRLVAHTFDAKLSKVTGDRREVADQISSGSPSGFAAFSVSNTGTLAYASGASANRQLVFFSRDGKRLGSVGPPGEYLNPALTRDGKQIAVARVNPQTRTPDIWIFDVLRGAGTRFTFDHGTEHLPFWSPDGTEVLFAADRTGNWSLFVKDLRQRERPLPTPGGWGAFPSDWSADGGYVIYSTPAPRTKWDIWALALTKPSKPQPILQSEFNERSGAISSDDRWLAYSSDETGVPQIYVQSFPSGGHKVQISTRGGYQPRWNPSGKEIFYVSPENKLIAVDVRAGTDIEVGASHELFSVSLPDLAVSSTSDYAVTAAGERFLVNTALRDTSSAPLFVILNWAPEGVK